MKTDNEAQGDEKPKRPYVVGKVVKFWRIKLKLTQAELSKACVNEGYRISRTVIAKIEAGIRSIDEVELLVLAHALKVDLEHLYPKSFHLHLKQGKFGDFTQIAPRKDRRTPLGGNSQA